MSNNKNVMQEFTEDLKTKGEELLLLSFPGKIQKLNEMLEKAEWNVEDLTTMHYDLNIPIPEPICAKKRKLTKDLNGMVSDGETATVTGTNVFVFPTGMASSNGKLVALMNELKPLIRQLISDANMLKMWISLMIPKIEDGNNFGVSVQEDMLSEVQSVEVEGSSYFDQISRYYLSRARLISKVAKYPHVEDYRHSVKEVDEKQYLSLWLTLREIRNHYSTLHDILTKNLDKVKKPRSSNSVSLY